MIVDTVGFESLNQLADLAPGAYIVVESIYGKRTTGFPYAVISEICSEDSTALLGVDVQILVSDQIVLFRDFQLGADGWWQDSYGLKSLELAQLMPAELRRFGLRARRAIKVTHDGFGTLSTQPGEGNSHGT